MLSSSHRPAALLAIGLVFALGQARDAQAAQQGVVVEEVSKGSAGEQAGIRAGDVLLGWKRPASPPANPEKAEGRIKSPFDWMWVEMEQGPRGAVMVTGDRDGKEISFEVPLGIWGIKVRPHFFDEEALEAYTEGQTAVGLKQFEPGIALWDKVVKSVGSTDETSTACWMYVRMADAWIEARRWKEGQEAYESARGMAVGTSNPLATAFIWGAIGRALERQGKYQDAVKAYESALAVQEEALGEGLTVARTLSRLGTIAGHVGNRAEVENYFKRALAMREKLAPNSLELAESLHVLAFVFRGRGDQATAEAYAKRALAIRESLVPDSLDLAATLSSLGLVAWNRGDLAAAETYQLRALTIAEKAEPDGLFVANCLDNVGLVSHSRGDLVTAETYYRRAVAIRERLSPNSLLVATSLNNLGLVAWKRGDFAAAETYISRALAIQEKQALPRRIDIALNLNNLGAIARDRGDLASAEAYIKRGLAIQDELAPNSLDVARSLANLGFVASNRGDLEAAETYLTRALTIQEKHAPDSLDFAAVLNNLGNVARKRGDLTSAEAHVKRALVLQEKLAPGSADEAESHHDLGGVYRTTNRTRPAADHLLRAIDALEAQIGKLGGTQEVQSGFGAEHAVYYRDYIDLLVDLNQPAEAFHILERSRARTLLAMLAERDLVFTGDVPEDLERERKRIASEYDQTQAKLGRLNPAKDQAQTESLLNRLRELRERQSAIVERIRQQSPRLASLQYPQPLDANGVRSALDAGTVLLSYSVGKEKSYVFALTANAGVQAYRLTVGEAQLREEVERFRSLIQRAQLGVTDVTGLVDRGKHLYETLIQPAAKPLATATRVLVIPDGPLHALPFAALVRALDVNAAGTRRDWQYLVEWKPLHVVVSATVYAELRKERQKPGAKEPAKTLIAFGDPTYPVVAAADDDKALEKQDAVVRSMVTRGARLTPLPATNSEVTAIAGLYREKAALYVGDAATEERAKSVAKDARYLHFASHGLLDERFPLNSGLALTIPNEMKEGQDNGILQAWEIFERVRIDADLVVLSACETGLGKEMGGEGLVGLTRAFEYAGARSVLASLWSVADETTAVLMTQLYGHLKSGKTKDDALRQAQLNLIRSTAAISEPDAKATKFDASHPFYWAAFQLNGDWR